MRSSALQPALPELADLPTRAAHRLLTRIRHYRAASPLNLKLPLPGPTGEDNACGSSPAAPSPASPPRSSPLLEQLAAAFATHNDALVPDDDLGRRLVRTIAHPAIAFARPCATADIDALLFAGAPDQRRRAPPHASPPAAAIVPLIQDRTDGSYDLTASWWRRWPASTRPRPAATRP